MQEIAAPASPRPADTQAIDWSTRDNASANARPLSSIFINDPDLPRPVVGGASSAPPHPSAVSA